MLKKLFKFGSNKDDIIEIWSTISGLPEVVPVKESHHFLPDWWIKTPKWQDGKTKKENITNKGTVKRCPAIPEFMSMGFVVPLWCDLNVQIFEDGSHKWFSPASEFSFASHGYSQLTEHLPNYAKPSLVLKPNCPWYIKTPPGVSMLQLPMLWHFNPTFTVAPGVIWTDIHHEINQQMMFHKLGSFNIQRGTPLAHYIPIRRENIPHEVKNETPELRTNRMASYYHVRTKFGGGYPQHRKDINKKGECPYHAVKK